MVVIEGIEKPGNLGAILRSADGAGADGIIVADPVVDVWNANVIRASLGTVFSLPLAVSTTAEAVTFLRGHGIGIVAARTDGTVEYDAADLRAGVAVVIGAEATGLSDAWRGDGVTSVRIPMLGLADSLNASATAAILLYEARRQRRAAVR